METIFHSKWPVVQLQTVVKPNAPIRYGIVQVGTYCEHGVPTVAINNLYGDYGATLHKTSPEIESKFQGSRVEPGDLLIAVKGATAGKVGLVPQGFCGNISRDLARIRCDSQIDPRVLLHLFRTERYQTYISKYAVGSTRKEISIHNLRQFEVPLPPQNKAERFLEKIRAFDQAIEKSQMCVSQTSELKKAIFSRAI